MSYAIHSLLDTLRLLNFLYPILIIMNLKVHSLLEKFRMLSYNRAAHRN